MDLFVYKCIYIVIIIILSLFFTLLPLSLKRVKQEYQQRVLSWSNAFAGGVFLASGFVHLLTEANGMVAEMENEWSEYPIAGILAVLGFLTIFFIEQVVLAKLGHTHSHEIELPGKKEQEGEEKSFEMEIITSSPPTDRRRSPGPIALEEVIDLEVNGTKEEEIIADDKEIPLPPPESSIRLSFVSLALVIVISAHSFFTGITMGAQSTLTSTTELLITVVSHKWIEAFALGTNLIRNGESVHNFIKLSLLYTTTLPLGVICGSAIVLFSKSFANITTMIATGFGSGSFIYIAIVDILVLEFSLKEDKMTKFFLVTLGFICITLTFIFFDFDQQ